MKPRKKTRKSRPQPGHKYVHAEVGARRSAQPLGENAIRSLSKADVSRLLEPGVLRANLKGLAELLTSRSGLAEVRFGPEALSGQLRAYRERSERSPAGQQRRAAQGTAEPLDVRGEACHNEIVAALLPSLVTPRLVDRTRRALERCLSDPRNTKKDVKSLLTGLFLLQSQKDDRLPTSDNPLWELIFNLSISDLFSAQERLDGLVEEESTPPKPGECSKP